MKTLLISIICCIGMSLSAQITNEHLKVFEGKWTGELTYTDYGDDKTAVTLPMEANATFSDKGVSFKQAFTEPSGRVENRTARFRLRKGKVYFEGSWRIENSNISSLDDWTLELSGSGKDNNREASFNKKIEVSPTEITVTKLVRYEGTEDYFIRNKYVYRRQ